MRSMRGRDNTGTEWRARHVETSPDNGPMFAVDLCGRPFSSRPVTMATLANITRRYTITWENC